MSLQIILPRRSATVLTLLLSSFAISATCILCIGVTMRAIRYYEADTKFPLEPVLKRISDLFEVSIDLLTHDKEEISLTKEEQFIERAKQDDKFKGKSHAQKFLESSKGLFAGGELSEHDKDALFESLTEIYFDAKKKAREKFTPKSKK